MPLKEYSCCSILPDSNVLFLVVMYRNLNVSWDQSYSVCLCSSLTGHQTGLQTGGKYIPGVLAKIVV